MTLLLLVFGLVGVETRPAAALTGVESCFYNAINRERSRVGPAKLALKDDLTTIARRHSRRMAADGTIYHNSNLGNEISGNWTAAGENVGMGPDCPSIHDAFMASPGHRSNILDLDFNQVGVGVAYDHDGTVYITEDFAGRRSPSPRRVAVRKPQVLRPSSKPRPALPKPAAAEPRTVGMLLTLLGLDAERVDAATGQAMGV